jgi:hypothetical protein
MDGINKIQAQLVNLLYLLTVSIGRTRNRLLLTTKDLNLACDGLLLFLHGNNSAWKICNLLFFNF